MRRNFLSWAIRFSVFQPVKFASTSQKLLATFLQILDIWWSSLDIMDDFKLIFRTVFWQNSKSWFVYFTETEKYHPGNDLKIIYFIQTWSSDRQKVENGSSHTNSNLLVNLTFWKTEYLIAQLRTGFRQKVFRLKTCPQAQYENSRFLLPLPSELVRLKVHHLKYK